MAHDLLVIQLQVYSNLHLFFFFLVKQKKLIYWTETETIK